MTERRCLLCECITEVNGYCPLCGEPQEGALLPSKVDTADTSGGAPSCDSAELAAIRKRLADWPYEGWATKDCHALLRMVDELRKELTDAIRAVNKRQGSPKREPKPPKPA